jgi:hypothetical protein
MCCTSGGGGGGGSCQNFADDQWFYLQASVYVFCVFFLPLLFRNCADPSCSSTVPAGSGQPNYECAEFVSRSLASGIIPLLFLLLSSLHVVSVYFLAGYVPNLGPLDPQANYGSYSYNGQTYDLLWTSSQSGGPLGVEDFLQASGWSSGGLLFLLPIRIIFAYLSIYRFYQ